MSIVRQPTLWEGQRQTLADAIELAAQSVAKRARLTRSVRFAGDQKGACGMSTWGWGGTKNAPDTEEARHAMSQVLTQECIRPEQFFRRSVARSGEYELVVAVIEEAIDNLRLSGRPRNCRLADEARRWIASDSEAPFSFVWCCGVVGLNAERLRIRLLQSPESVRMIATRAEYREWTEAERRQLRRCYATHTTREIAQLLGRSESSVRSQLASRRSGIAA